MIQALKIAQVEQAWHCRMTSYSNPMLPTNSDVSYARRFADIPLLDTPGKIANVNGTPRLEKH